VGYLVQRCGFKTDDGNAVTGVDSLFSYEYMGAAEYEFGSLNKSLRRIVGDMSRYSVAKTDHVAKDGRRLCVLARDHAAAKTALDLIAAGKSRHKCPTYMPEVLAGKDPKFYGTEVWWDLDEDWVAFLGEKRGPLVSHAFAAFAERLATRGEARK
jgi:hypothetical protein